MRVETIGDATLYLADCLEVLPTLGKVDAVITDPPYGTAALWKKPRGPGGKWPLFDQGDIQQWDSLAPIVESLPTIAETAVIWGGNYYPLPPVRGWLLWDKIVRQFSSGHAEMAWTTIDQPVRAFNYAHGELASEGKHHPTQKPLPLMVWCLEQAGRPRLTLDPFMGSGTTGVACAQMGLSFIGIEREPKYFDIACRRIEQAYKQRPLFEAEPQRQPIQTEIET